MQCSWNQESPAFRHGECQCAKAKLAVELDGSQHMESAGQRYDIERTKALKELGIEVIRFPNNAIWNNFSGVCIAIDVAVKRRLECMP